MLSITVDTSQLSPFAAVCLYSHLIAPRASEKTGPVAGSNSNKILSIGAQLSQDSVDSFTARNGDKREPNADITKRMWSLRDKGGIE